MKAGIMQPYFFPYLGYWQLIRAVDRFVILDDVNYIKRGYINKNSILLNGEAHRFSISIDRPSQNRLINETRLLFPEKERENLLKTVEVAYHKAPYFSEVFPVVSEAILFPESDLVPFLTNSIRLVCAYAGIDTEILISSEIEKDGDKKAQDRILEINRRLGSDVYINAIGGQALYSRERFAENGISLYFIRMLPCAYEQFGGPFVPNLSIIDVLMFNDPGKIGELLDHYELI